MFDLSSHLWIMITAFGGAGLTLPLAITIAVWLALGYSWQRAAAWLGVLAAAIGVVALTKIAFLGWGSASASGISRGSAAMRCCRRRFIRSRFSWR